MEGHKSEKDVIFWVQNIKVPLGIGHILTYTSNPVYMCVGGFRDPNLQTELNYLDSFKSYCNSSDLGFLSSGGWGRIGGVSKVTNYVVYMSSAVFRGKESSNRIELS